MKGANNRQVLEIDLSALGNDLAELQVIHRELAAQADGLGTICKQLPQAIQEPEAVRQLQKQQQDLIGQADQVLQLYRALEQIVRLVSQTETQVIRQSDFIYLKLNTEPPAPIELQLAEQTQGIRITW